MNSELCLFSLTLSLSLPLVFLSLRLPSMYTRNMIYAGLGAVIFSFYIIFDTQLIVGGKHNKFRPTGS